MENNRFVPIEKIKKVWKETGDFLQAIAHYNPTHCQWCGDTKPKTGFYPLLGYGLYQTSGFSCNRCRYNDEDYLRIFGEPKEVISE